MTMPTGASRNLFLGLFVSVAIADISGCGSPASEQDLGDDASPPASDAGQQVFTSADAGHMDAGVAPCTGTSCSDATVSVCGNGVVEPGETCDDGNTIP